MTAELARAGPRYWPRACGWSRPMPWPRGDARIAWDNGAAARDTASLWGQIETILAPAGLLQRRTNREGTRTCRMTWN